MVALTGPLATASREPRQARKGATVVVTLCAEVWLVRVTAILLVISSYLQLSPVISSYLQLSPVISSYLLFFLFLYLFLKHTLVQLF